MDRTDEELMHAYRAGDRDAFRILFERYSPLLLRTLRRDLDTPQEAEDLVQQTFLQLHRARADFRPGTPFRPWIFTIALNLKRGHFRSRARRRTAMRNLAAEPGPSSPDTSASAEAVRVRRALQELPDGQRDAIVLHWFEGLSFPEIAEIMGVKENALKVRAHRGYARLRENLGRDVTDIAVGHTSEDGRRGAS